MCKAFIFNSFNLLTTSKAANIALSRKRKKEFQRKNVQRKATCVGRGFLSIGLDLHASGDSHEGFSACQICYMNEGVVPGGENVGDSEHHVLVSHVGWPEVLYFLGLLFSGFFSLDFFLFL